MWGVLCVRLLENEMPLFQLVLEERLSQELCDKKDNPIGNGTKIVASSIRSVEYLC